MIPVALLLNSCATPIADFTFCGENPRTGGAACDSFLTSNPQTLTASEWIQIQQLWQSQGQVVECTTSSAVGSLKGEIEKLCSVAHCSYSTKRALKSFFLRQENVTSESLK
jgi:hypothetical protein